MSSAANTAAERTAPSSARGYAIALAAAVAAVVLRMTLDPFVTGVQFITFFPAALLVAFFCGSWPGLVTTFACAVAGWYLFLEPVNSFAIATPAELISLATFLIVSSAMCLSIGGLSAALIREKQHHKQQQLLIEELNHRVKNNLSLIQAIARQTLKPEVCRPEVRSHFEGRLLALASAHETLTRVNWESAELRSLIENLMGAIGIDKERITLSGPAVDLKPKPAISMTLAMHELATNAIKYGALSGERGHVDVEWSQVDSHLYLKWRERDGPPVERPETTGFGSTMLQRALPREFGGTVTLDFRRDGVVCTIDAPLCDGPDQ